MSDPPQRRELNGTENGINGHGTDAGMEQNGDSPAGTEDHQGDSPALNDRAHTNQFSVEDVTILYSQEEWNSVRTDLQSPSLVIFVTGEVSTICAFRRVGAHNDQDDLTRLARSREAFSQNGLNFIRSIRDLGPEDGGWDVHTVFGIEGQHGVLLDFDSNSEIQRVAAAVVSRGGYVSRILKTVTPNGDINDSIVTSDPALASMTAEYGGFRLR